MKNTKIPNHILFVMIPTITPANRANIKTRSPMSSMATRFGNLFISKSLIFNAKLILSPQFGQIDVISGILLPHLEHST